MTAEPTISPIMPTTNRPMNLGSAVSDQASRLDGPAKVTGRAKYGRDVYVPNSLFVKFIRCPWGNADLASIDQAAAEKTPGIIEVVLSGKSGQYDGATIGYLVGESPAAIRRAARALNAKWKLGPVQTRITDSIDTADEPATPADFDGADKVLNAVYTTEVQTHACLETHGASVDYRGDSATVFSSTQGTFSARDGLDDALGLPRSKYQLVCEFVGGGFGSKLFGAGKEGVTAAKVAAKHKRPTYLFVDRREEHLDTGNRPNCRVSVKVGFKNDGTVVGGTVRSWGGTGVAGQGGGVGVPTGRYPIELQQQHKNVKTNAGPPRPTRAPGQPQASFVEELMLEEIATACGLDALDYRMNLDQDAERREMMKLGADLISWKDRRPTGSQTGPLRRGFGLAVTSWHKSPAKVGAEVFINPDGSVEARTGTQDIGTGTRTGAGVMAADGLGIPLDLVSVAIGRSGLPPGPASGGSVTMPNLAPAMYVAATDARAQLLQIVANLSAADPAELSVSNGLILRRGEKLMTWHEACTRIGPDGILGRGASDSEEAKKMRARGSTNGVQLVDLEVDAETGVIRLNRVIAIQACGKAVCRKTAESQIIGAVIQGLSFALFENRVLDRNNGAMVNANLEMYKILGPNDMPHIEPILWPSKQTTFGPMGEPPVVPTAGAMACAVFNAIGSPVRDLPITPDKVLAAVGQGATS
ncbi:MAG: xanthine dehydrogenase family protein molybdopterin-binding subunit [Phycisphaeraceae bacterium]|nr:xanthine dehydrogenase family protein molybdopterin-binding subunit [Phycisphaeraceae bacterium]